MIEIRKCPKCGIEKPKTEFNKSNNRKTGLQTNCKLCTRADSNLRYKVDPKYKQRIHKNNKITYSRNRMWLISYLKEHPCVICGEADIVVLEFDHIDRSTKEGTISNLLSYGLKKIKREIDKCQVLCANCHRRKTAKEFSWIKLEEQSES